MKKTFEVEGMTCNSCERIIEEALGGKVKSVKANFKKDIVEVEYNSKKISEEKIEKIIESEGYKIKGKEYEGEKRKSIDWEQRIGLYVMLASLLFLAYFVYKWIVGLELTIPGTGDQMGIILLFLVGLLTGFHCVSMCGGFIVSYMAKNAKNGHAGFSQHLTYGLAKTISYIIIGGIFGFIGGIISFSVGLRAGVAIFAGLFMIAYALNMLGIKYFRKFSINPKFLGKFIGKASKETKGPYKAPLITGLLSGLFIACGPLQAMYIYAAGSGNAISGAMALGAFGLGTLPILLGFGGIATAISHDTMKKFMKISAIVVLILGLIMLNRGLIVMGSPISSESIKISFNGAETKNIESSLATISGDYQIIEMEVDRYGWSPDTFTLQKGIPVRWEINVLELTGCNNEILVNEYGLDIKLEKGMNIVEFTPTEAKTVRWSCWMGMIPGAFIITEDGKASGVQLQQAQQAAKATSSGGSCGASGGGCGCGGGY